MAALKPAEVHESFAQAFFAHDVDGLMTLYAEDAVMIPAPAQGPVTGHAAIRGAISELLALNPRNGKIETTLCLEKDAYALLRSQWHFDATSPEGEPMQLFGRGLEVVKRQGDGRWVQVFDNPWGGGESD